MAVLSGARWLPPPQGVWRACCDGISACLGGCIQYIQHTSTYILYIQYMHMYTHIHTHTCNDLGTSDTYRYIHIHTHTISVMKGFWGAAAAARVSYAQHHLPRSARTGLRTGSSSAHCDWMAHGLCRGAALAPPTRAACTGAPKRVWEWVPDRWITWWGCCSWLS